MFHPSSTLNINEVTDSKRIHPPTHKEVGEKTKKHMFASGSCQCQTPLQCRASDFSQRPINLAELCKKTTASKKKINWQYFVPGHLVAYMQSYYTNSLLVKTNSLLSSKAILHMHVEIVLYRCRCTVYTYLEVSISAAKPSTSISNTNVNK